MKFRMNLNIRLPIRCFLGSHPFIKKHLIHLSIMFILLVALIATIDYYHIVLFGKEKTTTSVLVLRNKGSFTTIGNSFIKIEYFPGKEDGITFFFQFENLSKNENEEGVFTIIYNGKMKKSKSISTLVGVTEVSYEETADRTYRKYRIDFQPRQYPIFYQGFLSNLFKDKRGEVELHLGLLFLMNPLDSTDIPVSLERLDNLNLEYIFPTPKERNPRFLSYIYDESFPNEIMIRGNNPYIKRKFGETHFRFGVTIAILASLLGTLSIEVIKDIK